MLNLKFLEAARKEYVKSYLKVLVEEIVDNFQDISEKDKRVILNRNIDYMNQKLFEGEFEGAFSFEAIEDLVRGDIVEILEKEGKM